MTTTELAEARGRSPPSSDADPAAGQRLAGLLRPYLGSFAAVVILQVIGVVGLTLTVQAMFTVLLVLGAYLALGGNIGAAEVLAILVLAARCADPLLSLSDIGGKLRGARSVLARLDTVLRTEPLPAGRGDLGTGPGQ